MPDLRTPGRFTVILAYATFALVGLTVGASGVLLPAQIADYGVGQAAVGASFFTSGAGFFLAGFSAGELQQRYGIRLVLAGGAAAYAVAGLTLAVRPSFLIFVAVQVLSGYGTGLLESALNAYVADLPAATARMNRLHAFFGVGALVGPVLAVAMLRVVAWPVVWLVLAGLSVPLIVGFRLTYPAPTPAPTSPGREPAAERSRGLVGVAVRQPTVVLAAIFLAVYVGLEISVGDWGFSFLVAGRSLPALLAGYTVSGYWLGLTLGRFLIGPFAARVGWSAATLIFACLGGTTVMTLLVWLVPTAAAASAAFVLLGFCLGPIFPTTMSVTPNLTQARLVATAIGIVNGVSVVGGALFPWLAGAIAQATTTVSLVPFWFVLSLLQIGLWRMTTVRMAAVQTEPGS
jgi:fucose permease